VVSLPNFTATWPEGTSARLYGCMAGVRAMLQDVALPEDPASTIAVGGASQTFNVCHYTGPAFDYYEAEIVVARGAPRDPARKTPIASWWLRSSESEAPGARDVLGLSRVVYVSASVAFGGTTVRALEANPFRRRLVLQAIPETPGAVVAPLRIGTTALEAATGLAIIVGGAPVVLQNTRPLWVRNDDVAQNAILSVASEQA
jgi:hypothetical protein